MMPEMVMGFSREPRRRHFCPVHGPEVCYMSEADKAHGCAATPELAGFWRSKTIGVD